MIVHVFLSIFVSDCVIFSTYPYVANQVYINSCLSRLQLALVCINPKEKCIYIYYRFARCVQYFKIHVYVYSIYIYIYLHSECSALILVEDQCCYVYL